MTFEDLLDQAIAMLQRRGRVTYRTLKLQFQLDDYHLEALKEALIDAERLAVDENGTVLVWRVGADGTPAPVSPVTTPPATAQERFPLAYTPAYLAERILTSAALEANANR